MRRSLRARWLAFLDRVLPRRPARRATRFTRFMRLRTLAESLLEPGRDLLRGSPAAVPALAALVVFLVLGASDGGFAETTWYPAALFALGLLVVALVSLPAGRPVPRLVSAAIGLLVLYALWSYLSIAWADDQAEAWDGANRTALYAGVLALFALWPVRAVPAALLLGALGLGVVGIGVVELLKVNDTPEAGTYFIGGRLAEPVGYPSANVAFWMAGFWPCVALAARREVFPPLRGAFLAGAVVLAGLALMGQTRGLLFAFPLAAVAFLVLTPGRVRAVTTLGAAVVGAAILSGPALEVYDAFGEQRDVGPVMSDATRAIVFTAGIVGFLAALAAYADARLRVPPELGRRVGVALLAAAALAVGGGLVAWVASENPVTTVSDAWDEFTAGGNPKGDEARLRSLGSNRSDFWRVALDNFAERPLWGVGADNFQQDYLEKRHSSEEPRHPHSLELRVLSETGLVGAALLFGALGAALVAAWRAVRASDLFGPAVAAGGLTVFAYWFVHGSIDWFWEFPALGAIAFACLGLATALRGSEGDEAASGAITRMPGRPWRLVSGWQELLPLASVTALAATTLALPWLAERHVVRATTQWRSDEEGAFKRLDRAAQLNPLASRPDLVAGSIALRLGQAERAQAHFRAALERDPRNAYATLELGGLESQLGRRDEAVRLLERAARANPRDETTATALRLARRGERLDLAVINRQLAEEGRARLR